MASEPQHELLHHHGDEPHLLRDILRTYQLLMESFPKDTGLTASNFLLLRQIAVTYPKSIGTMELSRRLQINAAAVSRLLQELKRKKWIERSETLDKRRNSVRLTATGREAFKRFHERSHQFELQLKSKISEQDMAVTSEVLEAIRAVIEEHRK